MVTSLTNAEARILGSLIEKSHTTPDQYPLSLNALKNACNQKTSRDPVMDLGEAEIARAISTLQEKQLVGRRMDPGSRVTKFSHHVENLIPAGTLQEIGAICLLLLRGAQTPGEIKSRTDRLCEFASVAEVETVLQGLMTRKDGAMAERLARQPGQKEARYRQLFTPAPVERHTSAAHATPAVAPAPPHHTPPPSDDRYTPLEKRVAALEQAVLSLQSKILTN